MYANRKSGGPKTGGEDKRNPKEPAEYRQKQQRRIYIDRRALALPLDQPIKHLICFQIVCCFVVSW